MTTNAESVARASGRAQACLLLALWIVAHPYFGVVHDAEAYSIQALSSLDPARWRSDIYVRYGTQDDFTLFTWGYRWLVAGLGVGGAALAATLLGQALWLAALCGLVFAAFERRAERLAALCGVIVLAAGYGGHRVFHYAEPFVTPRLFAEAAVIAALALALRRRTASSAAAFAVALVIHPLVTLPWMALAMVRAALRDRRLWAVLGLAGAAGALAIALGVGPFARAWQVYDPLWFAVVRARNDFAIVGTWSFADWAQTASTFAILCAGLRVAGERERPWIVSVVAVAAGGLALSFLGADIARNVLAANLQLWRALWLAALTANAALPVMLLRTRGLARALLAIGAALGVGSHFLGALLSTAPLAIIAGALAVVALGHGRIERVARVAVLTLAGAALGLTPYALYVQFRGDAALTLQIAQLLLVIAILSCLGVCLWRPGSIWLAPAAACLLAGGGALADQRAPWDRFVSGAEADPRLGAFVHGSAYWAGEDGMTALWFKLRRPSYYSCAQGTEAMFFRPLAMEWAHRQAVLSRLDTPDFDGTAMCGAKADPQGDGPRSAATLAAACRALPDLDTVVLDHPVPGLAGAMGTFGDRSGPGRVFYRYACAVLR